MRREGHHWRVSYSSKSEEPLTPCHPDLTVTGIGQKDWSDFLEVTYLVSDRTVRTKDVLVPGP